MGRSTEGWKLEQRADGVYNVRFTHPRTKERYHRSTGRRTEGEAAKKASEIYASVVGGKTKRRCRPAGGDLEALVSEWLTEIGTTRSPEWHGTLELYASTHWLSRWGALDNLTSAAIQKYIGERLRDSGTKGRRLSPVTLAKELSGLRSFLRWCVNRHYLSEVPSWKAPEPTSDYQPICLTRQQMTDLLAELPDRAHHPKRYPVREWFVVMWATSLRRGTLARLRWEDVDLKAGTITVRSSADKKRHGRVVPLTPEAVAALQHLLPDPDRRGRRPAAVGLVFGAHDFRVSLRSAAKRAKLPKETWGRLANHAVRHARLTDLASRSRNIAAIQHMAGHKDLASTMRYVHGALEGARDLLEEIGDGAFCGQNSGQRGR